MALSYPRATWLGGLLPLLFFCPLNCCPLKGQESAGGLSPSQAELRSIEQRIDQLRARGQAKLADSYERRLQAGLSNFERTIPREAPHGERGVPWDERLRRARQAIAKAREVGATDRADKLQDDLRRITQALESGEYDIEASSDPELHCVQLIRGSTLPEEFVEGTNLYKLGYAEVHVNITARPVTLLLSSEEPVLWNVKTADGVQIHAVILAGEGHQFAGPGSPLVLRTEKIRDGYFAEAAQALTGRHPATRLIDDAYSGNPFVIGVESQEWLEEYLDPKLDKIVFLAEEELRSIHEKALKDVRFRAIYFPPGLQGSHDSPSGSVGEFTIAGPVAESLMPLQHKSIGRLVSVSSQPQLKFALTDRSELVVLEGRNFPDDLAKVALSSDLPGRFFFAGLAYDSKREALVLASLHEEAALYRYNISTGKFSKLAPTEHFLCALTYSPNEDVVYGLTSESDFQPIRLCKFAPDGALLSKVELHDFELPELPRRYGLERIQFEMAGENLAIVIPAVNPMLVAGNPVNPKGKILVLDPKTGDTLSSKTVQLQTQKGKPTGAAIGELATNMAGTGILAQIERKLADAHETIARIAKQESGERVKELKSRLQEVYEMIQGKMAPRQTERLHLVGTYSQHSTTIRVTDKSGPVTLVVCSYEPGRWKIETEQGVDLKRIIVGGYQVQTVTQSPPGIPVKVYCSEQGTEGFFTYESEYNYHFRAVTRLKEITPLPISTLIGSYELKEDTIVVGPENGQWRGQIVLNALDQLLKDAKADQVQEQLSQHRFHALHFGAMPRQPQDRPRGSRADVFAAPFSIRGPLIGRGIPVPHKVDEGVVDWENKLAYLRDGNRVSSFNLETGEQEAIAFDPALPALSWPSGLAFDYKRRRLLLASYGGSGCIYSHDLASESWSVVRRPGLGASSTVYDSDQDFYYAFKYERRRGRLEYVKRLNSHGAFLDGFRVADLVAPVNDRRDQKSQLVHFKNHLAVMRYEFPDRRRREEQEDPTGTIYVINLRSGELVYEGELHPHVERKDLSRDALVQMWQRLASVDGDAADDLLWDMAAGEAGTIAFIKEKFSIPSPELNADIARLIQQLDGDSFAERAQAEELLASYGSRIAPAVEKVLAGGRLSPEVDARVRRLQAGWQSDDPPHPVDRRQVRAVEVLARIGTPNAVKLLERIAAGELGYTSASTQARSALQEMEKINE